MMRPRKMIQAFQDIGYEVFVITGVSSDRRELIRTVKQKIRKGEKYEFMYTESHTEPTLLTDPHHLPTHPFLDFGFFRFVRKHGIRIGLYYCDLYWKFDNYGEGLPLWKKNSALFCYRYDIRMYKKLLTKFYLPDMKICDYLNDESLTRIASALPPGADPIPLPQKKPRKQGETLQFFYVGGIGHHYQIIELVRAVAQVRECELTLCCRETEWNQEKEQYQPFLCDRIHIVHQSGDQLEPFYQKADIGSLLFRNNIYMELAIPFKAFEYLAHEIPIISTKGTAIGSFVEKNGIGWNIECTADAIARKIREILDNPDDYEQKRTQCRQTKEDNLWTIRARQVEKDLI